MKIAYKSSISFLCFDTMQLCISSYPHNSSHNPLAFEYIYLLKYGSNSLRHRLSTLLKYPQDLTSHHPLELHPHLRGKHEHGASHLSLEMALKLHVRFSFIAPPVNSSQNFNPGHHRWPSEVCFSRCNAEKLNQRRSSHKEIEDDIRRQGKLDAASKFVNINENDTPSSIPTTVTVGTETFRSSGKSSLPGKKSKYSKDPNSNLETHPAFQFSNLPAHKKIPKFKDRPLTAPGNVSLSKDGVSYVIDGAPFEFKYSYTETPKVEPLKLREPPFVPFSSASMPRPWTGRAPLPLSKKKLKEFDSFVLPPPHKKGIKPVQAPGPFLPGSGPKYVKSREEILGEPLTEEEIAELVRSCVKAKRQLNIGRDGLTHNMLDNIHAHWKRRRVCKIKCKGVCTVDMDNVYQQLEERTGGKIICQRGGTVYLFRGRNYNYRTRPRFPLMLWKPASPVYPRLIQRVPEGLTSEAVAEMRSKGRKLIPICKLGKNGVYCGLVKLVREAFEECELVRINCQGMNGSDFRKIGAKLRDLVPCVLLSFEKEHILMWRGQNWQSSILSSGDGSGELNKASITGQTSAEFTHEGRETSCSTTKTEELVDIKISDTSIPDEYTEVMDFKVNDMPFVNVATDSSSDAGTEISDVTGSSLGPVGKDSETTMNNNDGHSNGYTATVAESDTMLETVESSTASKLELSIMGSGADDKLLDVTRELSIREPVEVNGSCTEEVISLLKKAVDEGGALVLDNDYLDADIVFRKAVSFSKSAPPGPIFRHKSKKKKLVKNTEKIEDVVPDNGESKTIFLKKQSEKKSKSQKTKYFDEGYMNVVPQGSLRVDELAKLLG